MNTPQEVIERLELIERELAERQNDLEVAAFAHFRAKRDQEKRRAEAFMSAEGTVAERQARASIATADIGMESEAAWEALRAVVRVLDTRASIGQSLLRAQGRA